MTDGWCALINKLYYALDNNLSEITFNKIEMTTMYEILYKLDDIKKIIEKDEFIDDDSLVSIIDGFKE